MHIRHRIQSTATELIVAAVSATLIVAVPSPLLAQQKTVVATAQPARAAVVTEEEESASASKKPGDEGIKVHGHWTLDVKDKDGAIVQHRDFQNSLVAAGATTLINLLTGLASAEQMEVGVGTTNNSHAYGLIVSTSSIAAGATCTNYYSACFSNLARTYGVTNGYASSIILSGTVPAQSSAYTVTNVSSAVNSCGVSSGTAPTPVSPSACNGNVASTNSGNQFYISDFTAASISNLAVSAGQVLTVSFTLSFS